MEIKGKQILVCDCEKSMPLEGGALSAVCRKAGGDGDDLQVGTQLCRAQLGNYETMLGGDGGLVVACTQEAPLFAEVADEAGSARDITFANIREKAGWSREAEAAAPKIAALLAEASLAIEPTPAVAFESKGICLVYGHDESTIEAARQLKSRLDVTILLSGRDEVLAPRVIDVPIFRGRITSAKGHLGAFGINVDGYAPALPSSKLVLAYEPPQNNAFSECDLILDLTGDAPLFPAHERRDGYFRPDPGNPAEVQKCLFEIGDLVGEFEKPRYVNYDPDICAHGRSKKTGCTRCLDVCPVGAITSAGDTVEIDPHICGGCGMCASVCPTGAATYQLPAGDSLFERLRTLLAAYHGTGGERPALLVHDERHGEEMISLMARGGDGLPARVLPFAVNEVTQIGFDFLACAFAYGASQLIVLVGPDKSGELGGLASQLALLETVLEGLGYGGGRLEIIEDQDPDAVEGKLYGLPDRGAMPLGSFLPIGGKRSKMRLALDQLHRNAPNPVEFLPLPEGAPFGTIEVDTGGCTLCLACVSACPANALLDKEERPWLGFNEEACVQCGLCKVTCPESVITLKPRLNFTDSLRGAEMLNEALPFNCIRCGKPFGVKQTIDRISEQLAGKHWMFGDRSAVERIMMCDDCRVIVQFEDDSAPFKAGERPVPRTTADYLKEVAAAEDEDSEPKS